jgi:O-antigen/teichoic acid export membrane protein
MLDKTIIKNISSLFSIRVAGYIIPLITLPYLVRVLEPIGYGTLGFCLAIVQYFTIAVNYGFDLSATQKIAQNRDDKLKLSVIFWNVILVRVLIALFGVGFLLLLSIAVKSVVTLLPILLCAYVSVFATALIPQWLFQGKEQLGTISIVRVVLQVVNIPLLFLFVKSTDDIWVAALLSSLPPLAIVMFSAYLIIKRQWLYFIMPSPECMKQELQDGWHLFLSTAAISLYTTSTTVLLGIISGPVSVAIYVSANKLLQAAQAIYSTISASFYPRISNLIKKSKEDALAMIRYLMKIQFILTVGISICLYTFSPFVVELLFGIEYEKSATVLRILSVLPIITGLSNIFGVQVLLTYGYKKEFSTILLASGFISLITLIPLCYFYQSEGAAISVVITETIVTVLMLKQVLNKKIPLFKRVIINEI